MTFGICGGEAGAQWTGASGRIGRGRSGRGARATGRDRTHEGNGCASTAPQTAYRLREATFLVLAT